MKRLFVDFLWMVAAAASTVTAFKIDSVASCHVAATTVPRASHTSFLFSDKGAAVLGIPRGGGLQSAAVITFHGFTSLFFGVVFLLESFGVQVPLVGCSAVFEGWDATHPALKLLSRLSTSLLLGLGLSEIRFAEDETMQNIFVLYHVPLSGFLIGSSLETANGWTGWILPGIATSYLVAGLVAE